jgi:hypothetical protein
MEARGLNLSGSDEMKETPEKDNRARRSLTGRPLVIAAAVLGMVHACLVIEGRGIEGFILWVVILFFGYWLFFTLLVWLWRRYRDRA